MLRNKIVFQRLISLLRSIDPSVPLPEVLETKLWKGMDEIPLCKKGRVLEEVGRIPAHAYYVVSGLVVVYTFDEEGCEYVFRIYRKNTIVAMECFMKQYKSPFRIWACRGASVWSVSHQCMKNIYETIEGMKDFAWKTFSAFQTRKERMRNGLLRLSDNMRVLKFYTDFRVLLPSRKSPVLDEDIATFLVIPLTTLRRARRRLTREGRL